MKEVSQNSPISQTVSRRAVLGGLAAAAVLPAAGKKCKGYGTPKHSKKYANDDANVIRANFALWLLLSTSEQFFPITKGAAGIAWSALMGSQKQALVTDLCNLPGGTSAEKISYIDFTISWLNSGDDAATFKADVVAHDGTPIPNAKITYLSALTGVRQFFGTLSTGFPDPKTQRPTLSSGVTPAYTGHECPGGSREILSIATENPTALVPTGD